MVETKIADETDYEFARRMVSTFLWDVTSQGQTPAIDDIRQYVQLAISVLKGKGRSAEIDVDQLVRDLQTHYNVFVKGEATALVDEDQHTEWLELRKPEISWDYWKRYKEFILGEQKLPPEPFAKLDTQTDLVLGLLEDPEKAGPWSRRGLVVGQVQSGKTHNYVALINKAADAGYKLIIVLAGMWENLRNQTQARLNEGFLGMEIHRAFETRANARIGVGKYGSKQLFPNCGTSSAPDGDFNRRIARQVTAIPGGHSPMLLVIKKNKSVLENVLNWVLALSDAVKDEDGNRVIRDVPLLVIDDESDNASINTREVPEDDDGNVIEEHDPTAINGLIRSLLSTFEKNAYVGYTATPFANIFIDPDVRSANRPASRKLPVDIADFGDDLFPRSFIVNIPAPSNYIGPAQVFGFSREFGGDDKSPLNVIVPITDYLGWVPENHKNGYTPGPVPDSLRRAIRSFILVCAARIVRGQERRHNSMLVHVTRFTSVQEKVRDQIVAELDNLKNRLKYGDGAASESMLNEMKNLWNDDFIPVTEELEGEDISWDRLEPVLYQAASKIKVMLINGTAKDVLDYREPGKFVSVIAIGGNKLSRGLTLEDLSISYYLRHSRMYDTLMQMGRWFGYRDGYLDLCRVFTPPGLIHLYKHIALADAELRADFDDMVEIGSDPKHYGHKVRSHPSGLIITAVNKMRAGMPMKLSFAGKIKETTIFSPDHTEKNFERTERFIEDCDSRGACEERSRRFIWSDIPGDMVANYVSLLEAHPHAITVRPELLSKFILTQLKRKPAELTSWTVVLVGNGEGGPYEIAGHKIKLVQRNESEEYKDNPTKYTIGRLVSPADEGLDIEESERIQGKAARSKRPKDRGLLLLYPIDHKGRGDGRPIIGFALSFPKSDTAESVDYVVNKLYWQQELGLA